MQQMQHRAVKSFLIIQDHQFSKDQKWLGLTVVDASVTGERSSEVEFVARSRVSNAAALRQHERSRFVREGGKWLYVDGDFVKPRQPK